MGMYHDSLKDFKKYRKLSQHIGDALEVQRSYHSLGRAFFMLGITTKGKYAYIHVVPSQVKKDQTLGGGTFLEKIMILN